MGFPESSSLLCAPLSEQPLLTGTVRLRPHVMPRHILSKYTLRKRGKEKNSGIRRENKRKGKQGQENDDGKRDEEIREENKR